jgi:hypothetical protein
MGADDREDVLLLVMMVLDDHIAAQVHHRHHHAEAGQRGEHGRPDARPDQDVAERCGGRSLRSALAARDHFGDPLGVGSHEQHERKGKQADPARG